jgi:D-amino peptidase
MTEMKIHIMTDMEGCAGVMSAHEYIYSNSKYYEEARDLVSLEVSAAVEGALEAGATEVLVADGHGPSALKRSLLHPRAKLLGGRPYSPGQPSFGCDGTFAASIIIGQHAKTNTDGGHLCHTMSFGVEDYSLNGRSIGELGLWMLIAGYYNVPVVMVSGDQAACDEARSLVPNIEVAPVKWGIQRGSASGLTKEQNSVFNSLAVHLHPNEARAVIREHVCRAIKRIPEITPFRVDAPYTLTITTRPAEDRKRGEKVTLKSADFLDLMGRLGQPPKAAQKAAAKPARAARPAKPVAPVKAKKAAPPKRGKKR